MGFIKKFIMNFVLDKVIECALSEESQKYVANFMDDKVDQLQRKSKDRGRNFRRELLSLLDYCSRALKANDGVN